ncbi:MAG: DUF4834 family protein [Paramuribaculum sp.]|nr:DUF4834 family protein [Bacteroides sp.]MDE6827075.1 DUF4834 family protein [Paramuribaculum sp.]MDE7470790.1 DUF4834 family protein [Paramuribaculum sp.]
MLFFLFILVILFILIGLPALRAARRINAFRNQMNEMASRARQAYGQAAGAYGGQRDNRTQPARKKRIGADVGEYVEWEDIEVTAESRTYSPYTGEVEEQVTDAEWEEVRS